MKVASRDIIDILRLYELASDDNVPRNIENIKITHTTPTNTLVNFLFMKKPFYILFDDIAEDNVEAVSAQIKTSQGIIEGELIENPKDINLTYAMPFRSKDCYLLEAKTNKQRLDVMLASKHTNYSRSVWQKFIKAGYIEVDGKLAQTPRLDVTETSSIKINIPEAPDYSHLKLEVIFMDDNVIVINKPVGVLVHSKGALNEEFTVAEFFRSYTSYNLDTNRPGIVHRLDRDTSGVLIGARNSKTADMLKKQFADRETKKTYYAITTGIPHSKKARIDVPIIRNPSSPSSFKADINGKDAITDYRVISCNEANALIELQPITGRTHQLRVHMKYLKTPIIGDRIYGSEDRRLFLHAAKLEIIIPDNDRQTFTSPLPEEFNTFFPELKL